MGALLEKILEALSSFSDSIGEFFASKAEAREQRREEAEERRRIKQAERDAKRAEKEAEREEKEAKKRAEKEAKEAVIAEKKRLIEEEKAEKRRIAAEKALEEEKRKLEERRKKEEKLAAERAEKARIAKERREEQERIAEEKRQLEVKKAEARAEEERKRQEEKEAALAKQREAKEAEKRAKEEKDRLQKEEREKARAAKRADADFRKREKEAKRQEKERQRLENRKKKTTKNKKTAKKLLDLEARLKQDDNNAAGEGQEELLSLQDMKKKRKGPGLFKVLTTNVFSFKKTILAIEIFEDKTYIAELVVTDSNDIETKRVTLSDMFTISTPSSTFVNGALTNTEHIGLEIMRALIEHNISSKEVIFVSNDKSIFARNLANVHLQTSEKANLEMVRNMSNDLFPVDLADYIIRYKVLEKKLASGEEKEEKPNISLNIDLNTLKEMFKKGDEVATLKVFAFPRVLEENYRQLASLCSLNILAIDYSLNSLINFISREYRDKTETIIDIGEEDTTLLLIANGKLLTEDKISVGYSDILAKLKLYDIEYLGSTIDEVLLNLKDKHLLEEEDALNTFAEAQGLNQYQSGQLYSALEDIKEGIGKIINTSIHMMDTQKEKYADFEVNGITVLCNKHNYPDMSEDFLQATGLTLDAPESYLWITTISKEIPVNEFRHIIGSALDSLNFKDKAQEISKETEKRFKMAACGILILGALSVCGVMIYSNHVYNQLLKDKAAYNQKLAEYKQAETIANRHKRSVTMRDAILDFNEYTSNSDKIPEIIAFLEETTPKSVVFDTIASNDSALVLSLTFEKREDAIKLLQNLEGLEFFDSINTTGIAVQDDGELGGLRYAMTITCVYHVELPPPPETTAATETTESAESKE